MILKNRLKNPSTLIRIGSVSLLIAMFSRWFLQPGTDFWRGFMDAGTGVLFGISFGCYLAAARMNRLRRSGTGNCQGG